LLDPAAIKDWHAHIYFEEETRDSALALRAAIEAAFPAGRMGRFHERPVGPHPVPMYQVAFAPDLFATILPWLALNRGRLTVFVHPNVEDAVKDHTVHAVWLGRQWPLNLEALR
jgi:DOPA 4,5-dioxygenase